MSWLRRAMDWLLRRSVAKREPTSEEVIRKFDRTVGADLREFRRYEILIRRR